MSAGWGALADSPLAWPVAPAIDALVREGASPSALPEVARIDRALGAASRVRFVPSPPRGRGPGRRRAADATPRYDQRITEQGEVMTRSENLHDLMNALVWATFPLAKRAVHARQHAMIGERLGPRGEPPDRRSPEQDAVAMLDEGGVLLLVEPAQEAALEQAVFARDVATITALVAARRALGLVFGHALYEHLAVGAPSLVWGHATLLACPVAPCEVSLGWVDQALAARVADRATYRHPKNNGSAPLRSDVLGTSP